MSTSLSTGSDDKYHARYPAPGTGVGTRTYEGPMINDPSRRPRPVGILGALDEADKAPIIIRGSIDSAQIKRNKLGNLWAIYVLGTNKFDIVCMVFPRTYEKVSGLLQTKGLRVETTGIAYRRGDDITLVVSSIRTVDDARCTPANS